MPGTPVPTYSITSTSPVFEAGQADYAPLTLYSSPLLPLLPSSDLAEQQGPRRIPPNEEHLELESEVHHAQLGHHSRIQRQHGEQRELHVLRYPGRELRSGSRQRTSSRDL